MRRDPGSEIGNHSGSHAAWLAVPLLLTLAGCGALQKRPAAEVQAPATARAPSTAATAHSAAAPAPSTAAPAARRQGAYYQDDGPGDNPPANLDEIPDAVPKIEPLRLASNRPYAVFGREYVPQTALQPFRQRGVASWYGRKFHGSKTSSGEPYDMYAMTAAHPTLPIPSYVKVTSVSNRRSVIVRVNDRGPFHSDRIMDLSYAAAHRLGFAQTGSALVEIESIDPASFAPPAIIARAPANPEREITVGAETIATAAPAGATSGKPVVTAPPVEERALQAPPQLASASAVAPTAASTSLTAAASSPLAASATAGLPLAADARGVFLQLGAFSQRENAESFRARIYQQLGWLNDTIHLRAGDGLFRLQLGPYRDRGEAEDIARKIRDALELKPAFILK
jgi:rare lipoprotein A